MSWNLIDRETYARAQERGRPWPRLARGALWAVLAVFVISILAFWVGHTMLEEALDDMFWCGPVC